MSEESGRKFGSIRSIDRQMGYDERIEISEDIAGVDKSAYRQVNAPPHAYVHNWLTD